MSHDDHCRGPSSLSRSVLWSRWPVLTSWGVVRDTGVPCRVCILVSHFRYGGPGGGESSSPPARTNGNTGNNNGHSSNSSSSRTATPTTTSASANDWSSEGSGGSNGGGVAAVPRLQAGATCSWEWWPPDPPEEWALSPAHPWEPPPAPGTSQ